jgi:hypothetical protein
MPKEGAFFEDSSVDESRIARVVEKKRRRGGAADEGESSTLARVGHLPAANQNLYK